MKFEFGLSSVGDALVRRLANTGRVQLPNFLAVDVADSLRSALADRQDWHQVLNAGDKVYDLSRSTRASLGKARLAKIDQAVYEGARRGFQYRFESIRVPDEEDERIRSGDILAGFARWMSCGSTRTMLRTLTGCSAIDFADAQATAYAPGDFLTLHHDEAEGKGRRFAYVLGLTPGWRPEWGGLLLFHNEVGDVVEGWAPRYNTLNVFAVPSPHSVSMVTPIAPHPRVSVTGWLRSSP